MAFDPNPATWRLQTASGVKYRLREGFPRGSYERNDDYTEFTAVSEEQYIILASDLETFLGESIRPPIFYQIGNVLTIVEPRMMPGTNLVTKSITFEPFLSDHPGDPFGYDPTAPEGTYDDFLLVNITYTPSKYSPNNEDPPEDQDPTTWLEVSSNTAAEFLMTPARGTWDAPIGEPGAVKIDEINIPFGRLYAQTEWTVRWPLLHQDFLDPFVQRSRDLLGTVNSAPMPLLHNPPAETIMFLGYSASRVYTWMADEPAPIQFEHKFLEKRREGAVDGGFVITGHNNFFDPKTGRDRKVFLKDGNPVHEIGDLNTLFVWP